MEIADWLKNDQKQLKSSRVDNSGVPRLHPAKTGTLRFRPMAGLVGCVFLLAFSMYLFLAPNRQGIPVFGRYPNIYMFSNLTQFGKSETPYLVGCLRRMWLGWVSVFDIKSIPTYENYVLWEKVAQMPLLIYFFLGWIALGLGSSSVS